MGGEAPELSHSLTLSGEPVGVSLAQFPTGPAPQDASSREGPARPELPRGPSWPLPGMRMWASVCGSESLLGAVTVGVGLSPGSGSRGLPPQLPGARCQPLGSG